MAEEKKVYSSLEHTSKISLRTFIQVFSTEDYPDGVKIQSEGAYKIGLLWTTDDVTKFCFATVDGGDEVQLFNAGGGRNIVVPFGIWYLDGNVNTVRDDIIEISFSGDGEGTLIAFFDRIVWKKDDNYYPTQAADRAELNELNGKGNPNE